MTNGKEKRYDDGAIPRALKMLASGASLTTAAREQNIPRTTLADLVTRNLSRLNVTMEGLPAAYAKAMKERDKHAAAKAAANGPTSQGKKRSKLSLKGARETKPKSSQKLGKHFKSEPQGEVEPSASESPEESTPDENLEEEKKPCVAAIHNLGNTCYLNSVLQVLRHTPGFVEQLRVLAADVKITVKEKLLVSQVIGEEDEPDETFTWTLVRHLNDVYRKMSLAEKKYGNGDTEFLALRPYDLMDTIERLNPMFEGNLQHDAHEVLRCLLAYIQDATVEVNKFRTEHRLQSGERAPCPKVEPSSDHLALKTPEKKLIKSPPVSPMLPKQYCAINKTPEKVTLNGFSKPLENGYVSPVKIASPGKKGYACEMNLNGPKTVVMVSDILHRDGSGDNCPEQKLQETFSDMIRHNTDNVTSSEKEDAKGKVQRSRKRKLSIQDENEPGTEEAAQKTRSRGRPRSRSNQKRKRQNSPDPEIVEEDCEESCPETESAKNSIKNQPSIMSMLYKKPVVKRLGVRGTAVGPCLQNGQIETSGMNGDCTDSEKERFLPEGSTVNGHAEHVAQAPLVMTVKTRVIPTQVELQQVTINKQTARKTLGIRRYGTNSAVPNDCSSQSSLGIQGDNENLEDGVKSAMEELQKLDVDCQQDVLKSDAMEQGQRAVVKLEEMTKKNKYFPMFEKQLGSLKAIQSDMDVLDMLGKRSDVNDAVEDVFQGSMALRTRCLECENYTERREDYQDVGVPVRKEEVEDDWPEEEPEEEPDPYAWIKSAFHEVERLEGDNKYFCDSCRRLVEAERSLHYMVTPAVLTLHLKRFATMSGLLGGLTKINDHVVTPLEMPCMQAGCGDLCNHKEHRYQLYAMITHTGISMSSGHYVAYVRAADGLKVPVKQEEPDSGAADEENCNTPTNKFPVKTEQDEEMLADPNNNADTNNNVGSDCSVDRNLKVENASRTGSSGQADTLEFEEICANQLGMWLECDDDTITVLTAEEFDEVLSPSGPGSPYLLFYRRIGE